MDHDDLVWIKFRAQYDYFQRSYAPAAFAEIDAYLDALQLDDDLLVFEEHESGPEIVAFVSLGAATLSLAASIIDLVAKVLAARSNGTAKGDKSSYSLDLTVRTSITPGRHEEVIVCKVRSDAPLAKPDLERGLIRALGQLRRKRHDR